MAMSEGLTNKKARHLQAGDQFIGYKGYTFTVLSACRKYGLIEIEYCDHTGKVYHEQREPYIDFVVVLKA